MTGCQNRRAQPFHAHGRDPAGRAVRAALSPRLRNRDLRARGRVETRYGEGLQLSVVSEAGDFLFVPPDVPHEATNLSQTEPARAIVARNDPAEQDKVDPYVP